MYCERGRGQGRRLLVRVFEINIDQPIEKEQVKAKWKDKEGTKVEQIALNMKEHLKTIKLKGLLF